PKPLEVLPQQVQQPQLQQQLEPQMKVEQSPVAATAAQPTPVQQRRAQIQVQPEHVPLQQGEGQLFQQPQAQAAPEVASPAAPAQAPASLSPPSAPSQALHSGVQGPAAPIVAPYLQQQQQQCQESSSAVFSAVGGAGGVVGVNFQASPEGRSKHGGKSSFESVPTLLSSNSLNCQAITRILSRHGSAFALDMGDVLAMADKLPTTEKGAHWQAKRLQQAMIKKQANGHPETLS
ncbi:unnamed protein product, partial [Chrysoparadoxa australica]